MWQRGWRKTTGHAELSFRLYLSRIATTELDASDPPRASMLEGIAFCQLFAMKQCLQPGCASDKQCRKVDEMVRRSCGEICRISQLRGAKRRPCQTRYGWNNACIWSLLRLVEAYPYQGEARRRIIVGARKLNVVSIVPLRSCWYFPVQLGSCYLPAD